MVLELHGLVQGNTVVLDEAVPQLEGKRVRVILEPVELPRTVEEPALTREQRAEQWRAWVASGPTGRSAEEREPGSP